MSNNIKDIGNSDIIKKEEYSCGYCGEIDGWEPSPNAQTLAQHLHYCNDCAKKLVAASLGKPIKKS